MRYLSVLGGILIGLVACRGGLASHTEPPGSCFDVSYTAWQPGEGRRFYEPLPTHIRLTTARLPQLTDSTELVGYRDPIGPEGGRLIWWRRPTSDSAVITVHRGWSAGFTIRMRTNQDLTSSLAGALEDYADYGPRSAAHATVSLEPARCRASVLRDAT